MNEFITTCLDKSEDKKDKRDYQLASIMPEVEIPERFLIENLSPVFRQKYGSCFPKGTPVLMEDFIEKAIEDVRVFDRVYSHKGKKQKVKKLYKRFVRNVYELDISGVFAIEATEEHPFFVMKNTKERKKNVRDGLLPPEFIEIKDIEKKDFIGLPIIKDYKKPILSILEDKDFLKFLGYYLAEGSIDTRHDDKKARITLTLNLKEKDFRDDIIRISEKLFGITPSVLENIEGNSQNIRIYDTSLSMLVHKLCGHLAWEKELCSEIMNLKPELQKEILMGWFRGDGYSKENRRLGTSVSKKMTKQLWQICLRNEIKAHLRKHAFVGEGKRQAYDIEWTNGNNKGTHDFIEDGYLWRKLKGKEKRVLRQNVYNIEVEEDNSYIVNGVAVHNCTSAASVNGVKEQQEQKALSEYFNYVNSKKISGIYDQQGEYVKNALKAICDYGVCEQELFPDVYPASRQWIDYVKKEPSTEAYKNAEKYKGKTYWSMDSYQRNFREALFVFKTPIVFAMKWYSSYNKCDGVLPLPDNWVANHAVCAVGYNENYLIVKNSFGTGWGDKGYFYIPFKDWKKHTIYSPWVLLDKENIMQKIIGDNLTKNQFALGADNKVRLIYNKDTLEEGHKAGNWNKEQVEWVDGILAKYEKGKDLIYLDNE